MSGVIPFCPHRLYSPRPGTAHRPFPTVRLDTFTVVSIVSAFCYVSPPVFRTPWLKSNPTVSLVGVFFYTTYSKNGYVRCSDNCQLSTVNFFQPFPTVSPQGSTSAPVVLTMGNVVLPLFDKQKRRHNRRRFVPLFVMINPLIQCEDPAAERTRRDVGEGFGVDFHAAVQHVDLA